ncbi:MAG: hypothetical protein ABIS92_01340 [Polyangia bacterium]
MSKRFSVGLLLLILFLPGAAWLVGFDYLPELTENRAPHQVPALPTTLGAWKAFPKAFEPYWNDVFGFRRLLIFGNGVIHFLAGVSPSSQVLIGDQSWLFFAGSGVVERFRGQTVLSIEQLEEWRKALAARQQAVARHGGHYLFVVAPDKDSIYPEHFPDRYDRIGPTPFQVLLTYLRAHGDIAILDLRPALIAAKSAGPLLYLRTDTHWNERGAYHAYQAVMQRVAAWYPDLQPRSLSSFQARASQPWCGDLGIMVGLCAFIAEEEPQLVPTPSPAAREILAANLCSPGARRCEVQISEHPSAPSAIVFHDSFFVSADQRNKGLAADRTDRYRPPPSALHLSTMFGEKFSRTLLAWQPFDEAVVARDRPDVVIEELVERYLVRGPPQ